MIVTLFRHGIAEDYHPEGDPSRALTEAGKAKVLKMANFLSGQLEAEIFLSSPYVRAVETAEIVMNAIGFPKNQLIQTESLTPMANPEFIIEELRRHKAKNAILFGHNPHLSILCATILQTHGIIELKKASALILECRDPKIAENARILGYYTAGMLP